MFALEHRELLGAAQGTIAVDVQPPAELGWMGSPANESTISGVVSITLARGVTLASLSTC
jgi:hypothetical protein